jgi:S-DNA-T family DNA segregation ATPase FtsK/SpoIIIE
MSNKYKLVIYNKKIYKEVELPDNINSFKIGTTIDCDYRLHKEWFFEEIVLDFQKINSKWSLMCSDNLYISTGESKKLLNINLSHGTNFILKYQDNNNDVFNVEFEIVFDDKKVVYNRQINISGYNNISIGSCKDCQIYLEGEYLQNDKIVLVRNEKGFLIKTISLTYDVKRNGNKIMQDEQVYFGDFISIANFSFYILRDFIWAEASEKCKCVGLNYMDYSDRNNYPRFVRNTRVKYILDEEEIEILDPPSKPQKPKNNIIMSLLPSFGMLVAAGIMAYMGGTTMLIFSGISASMAIVTTVVGLIQGKKEYKQDVKTRESEYMNYISNKRSEIEGARKTELKNIYNIYRDQDTNKWNLNNFSSDLFDREKKDQDFLHVTVGKGTIDAHKKIKYKKIEKLEVDDELQLLPQKLCDDLKTIQDSPIVCDFKASNAVGIIGDKTFRHYLLNDIVFDICSRQFYSDVKLFFIMESKNEDVVKDFRLLPYVTNTISGNRNIVCDEESKKIVFEFIYNELTRRANNKEAEYVEYVIFFYDLYGFASHPISKFVDSAAELGVTFVFFSAHASEVPQGCDYLMTQIDENVAELVDTTNISLNKKFGFYKIENETIRGMNYLLAPVEAEEISLEGSLTKNIDLYTLLNIISVEDLDLKKRWNSTKVYKSMAAPLGVSKSGIVYLDLHDKAHGPHGLVAGTTGSGKSEILQSYILSVVTLFHPYEIGFLIIDFKGGGMVNQFKDLPHLLGAITNIDGKEIDRSLKSIKAELQKRQRLFADAEVNHIDKYIQKYKEGKTAVPLPHLIIIVDEFAELKAEQPDFMKELISAARIGRSLGVHLILATQKPAGQVDEQIWSNSRFKLCLKVQGPEDSNEVLKSPLAAEIKEPGRAYFQVGNNEIFELFQSAYSGASAQSDDAAVKEYSIYELELSGRKKKIFERKRKEGDKKGKNQLEAIVSYVAEYCNQSGIKSLPEICIKALESQIIYEECEEAKKYILGIYDDPDNQYQGEMPIDIDNKNTFIVGSSQYGKTNILQLLIRQIALKKKANEANIYILDFGSLVLKNFDDLSHVGGVVCPTDDEKLKNLFKLLQEELVSRREKMVSVGVSSFSSYIEAGYKDLPHIYIFVDNMTALMELYLENDETFLGIIREGVAVGISVIISNSQTNGIGYRYLSNFANMIALYCNDSNEYGNVFEHVNIKPEEIPGRCIIEYDKRLLECQTFLAFEGEKEIDRVTAIRKFVEEINKNNSGIIVKHIPYIPAVLSASQLEDEFGAFAQGYKIPIGLSYNAVAPFELDFSQIGALGLCGKDLQLHINFIKDIINQMCERRDDNPIKVCIFDDVNRKLKDCKDLPIVSLYTIATEPIVELLSEWNYLLQTRYQQMIDEVENMEDELLLLIINNNDVAKTIYEDMDAMNQYTDMITRYKNLNVGVIFTNYENINVSYDAPEPIRNIKQERHLLYFDDLDNLKVFDVAYEDMKANKKRLQGDDAYYIKDNSVLKIKLKCSRY